MLPELADVRDFYGGTTLGKHESIHPEPGEDWPEAG